MRVNTKIAISLPDIPTGHFLLRLKQTLVNEECIYKEPSKILAISDIEGNYWKFLRHLRNNGVIDKYLNWTFRDGHLVILGDCFDRGDQVIECLWLIYSLEEKAKRRGGHVHFILGNHEIMNMNGDWRYVHPKYAKTSKIPYTALYHGNSELWRWICTKNIIEKIGSILFVHAGISQDLLGLKYSILEINCFARPYYHRANEYFENPLLQIIYNKESSPFWYRGYYGLNANEHEIDNTLKHFDSTTIITGHTVTEKITCHFNGKVININTDHNSERSAVLLITNGEFSVIDEKKKKFRIK